MPMAAGGEYRFDMMSGQAIARPYVVQHISNTLATH
jgi:hypothetical protein